MSHEHSTTVSSTDEFTLEPRYKNLVSIGKGSYGVVCSALDSSNGTRVAIKKIAPVFRHVHDVKHALREIRLIRHMGKHSNVVSLLDLHLREDADELYIIMELMDCDLHKLLQSDQMLTEKHIRYFLAQLLCGVHFLHSHRIIHRDLKPGNILVSRDCKLRITDFGVLHESLLLYSSLTFPLTPYPPGSINNSRS
jgi:serine/threonine protein kinase